MIGTFCFDGKKLNYISHIYNRASENMRTVEVPIIRDVLCGRNDQILEIGNVLSHYGPISWPVLDMKEKGPRVINADLMSWQPENPFDLIVSISTLEHIGHGRYATITGPVTPVAVLNHILSWLVANGEAVLTVPVGYNSLLDHTLKEGTMPVERVRCMRRISAANEWEECTLAEAMSAKIPAGYPWTVGMVVLYCRSG